MDTPTEIAAVVYTDNVSERLLEYLWIFRTGLASSLAHGLENF